VSCWSIKLKVASALWIGGWQQSCLSTRRSMSKRDGMLRHMAQAAIKTSPAPQRENRSQQFTPNFAQFALFVRQKCRNSRKGRV